MSDERVTRGTAAHLAAWRAALEAGAERAGWKIGLNAPAAQERAGIAEPVVGHITSATVVEDGGTFSVTGTTNLVVEPEVAARLGEDGTIVALAPALEIVDVDGDIADIEPVLAGNVFHRGVVFGAEVVGAQDLGGVTVRALRDGAAEQEADAAAVAGDLAAYVDLVGRTLAAHGEAPAPGERVICGTLTPPLPARAGETIAIDLGPLGGASVRFTD